MQCPVSVLFTDLKAVIRKSDHTATERKSLFLEHKMFLEHDLISEYVLKEGKTNSAFTQTNVAFVYVIRH